MWAYGVFTLSADLVAGEFSALGGNVMEPGLLYFTEEPSWQLLRGLLYVQAYSYHLHHLQGRRLMPNICILQSPVILSRPSHPCLRRGCSPIKGRVALKPHIPNGLSQGCQLHHRLFRLSGPLASPLRLVDYLKLIARYYENLSVRPLLGSPVPSYVHSLLLSSPSLPLKLSSVL
jgi:hypothetical protein